MHFCRRAHFEVLVQPKQLVTLEAGDDSDPVRNNWKGKLNSKKVQKGQKIQNIFTRNMKETKKIEETKIETRQKNVIFVL